MLADTLRQMASMVSRTRLRFVTSAYSSYSSCRQYQQNIANAQAEVGPAAPRVEKLRAFYNHPLFVEANVDRIRTALLQLNGAVQHLAFTAHSIPESMAANCDYAVQLDDTARLVADAVGVENWKIVYQSRSGSPSQPWLGPDICDHLKQLQNEGVTNVVVAPIGLFPITWKWFTISTSKRNKSRRS